MRCFSIYDQQLGITSGLAVQKSQANRNSGMARSYLVFGLAVQKSQANRNPNIE